MFCIESCVYLHPKETKQSHLKERHKCLKYGKQVFHGYYHPEILAVPECDEVHQPDICPKPKGVVSWLK